MMLYSSCTRQRVSKVSQSTATTASLLDRTQTHLASGINNLCGELLALVLDHLGKGVLNSRIVRLHKVAIHKLHSQRRFACR